MESPANYGAISGTVFLDLLQMLVLKHTHPWSLSQLVEAKREKWLKKTESFHCHVMKN